MSTLPPDLQALIDDVLRRTAAHDNPFFVALRTDLPHGTFVATQLEFFHAVVAFHRPMAALAARIDDDELRTAIFRNVHEELGEGDASRAHGTTFITFLSRLTSTPEPAVRERLSTTPAGSAVRAFNAALQGACVVDDVVVGAAAMGIIERMFAEISSWIGTACVARGFIDRQAMIHYDLHERIDVGHADDFFRVLAGAWATAHGRRHVEDGLRLGAFVFDRLYRDLLASAQRVGDLR
jgi:hypothetical protein